MKARKLSNISFYVRKSESRLKIMRSGKSLSSVVNFTKLQHSEFPNKEMLEYAKATDKETKPRKQFFLRARSASKCVRVADSYCENKYKLLNEEIDRIQNIESKLRAQLSKKRLFGTKEPERVDKPSVKTGQNKRASIRANMVKQTPKAYMNKFERIDDVIQQELDNNLFAKKKKLEEPIQYNDVPVSLDFFSSFKYLTKRTILKVSQIPKKQIYSILNEDLNALTRYFSQSVSKEEFCQALKRFASIG